MSFSPGLHALVLGLVACAGTEAAPTTTPSPAAGGEDPPVRAAGASREPEPEEPAADAGAERVVRVAPEDRAASDDPLALGPVEVGPYGPAPITGATIGPDGWVSPHGISGGDPAMELTERSRDPTYGYSERNPIRLGGFTAASEHAYFNALWGPEGQPVRWGRVGSCCSELGPPLDQFALTYPGREGPDLILYVDLYRSEPALVPMGLTSPALVPVPALDTPPRSPRRTPGE